MKTAGNSNFGRCVPYIVWGLVFVLAYWYLQHCHAFHFLFIEQEHLFLYDAEYLRSSLFRTGGLAGLTADFLIQYYCIPHVGAAVTSALSVLVGVLLYLSFRREGNVSCILPALIPVAVLVFSSYNEAFSPAALVAFLFMSAAIWGFSRIRPGTVRVVYAVCATAALFFTAGPVAALFAVCILVPALARDRSRCLPYLLPVLLVAVLVALGLRCQWFGELRHILLPDGYYTFLMHPDAWIYATWWCFPLAIVLSVSSRLLKPGKASYVFSMTVCAAALAVTGLYMHKQSTRMPDFYKELDYYMYMNQPDKVIEACRGRKLDNYVYRNILNWALARKGVLADEAFNYSQFGPQSIILDWQKIPYTMTLLSNIYMAMGHVALSQRMAFESIVSNDNSSPRMLQRLVETNLIYGQYEVADKYISRLKKTRFYRDWASSAYCNPAIEEMRRCLPADDGLSGLEGGLAQDLLRVAEANPSHTASVMYAGMLFLMEKDMESFVNMLDRYYGTDVLPSLPKHFQEAVLVYTERNRSERDRFDISDETYRRYEEFKRYFSANRKKANVRAEMGRKFGDSYWFYFLY